MLVCSPEYAQQYDLTGKPENLGLCTLLHDSQAWSFDSDVSEWTSWANHFGVNINENQRSMGFDRSDLAVIAVIRHTGSAMGRKKLVSKRLAASELVMPFSGMEMACAQHYYISTLAQREWPKIKVFIQWIKEKTGQEC